MPPLHKSPKNDLRRKWRESWDIQTMTQAELDAGTITETRSISPALLKANLTGGVPSSPTNGSFLYASGGSFIELADPGDGTYEITFSSGVPTFAAAGGGGVPAGDEPTLTTGTDTTQRTWPASVLRADIDTKTPTSKLPQSPAAGALLYGSGGNYVNLAPPSDGEYTITWSSNVPTWTTSTGAPLITQTEINTGTETAARTISPKIFKDNIPWENVVAHGADSTGATDASDEIQAAVDNLPATGGIVFFPPGTYRYDAGPGIQIFSKDNVQLIGYGATIQYASGAANAGNSYGVYVRTSDNVSVRGLKFDGQLDTRTVVSVLANHAVMLDGVTNFTALDVTVIDWVSDGFFIGNIQDDTTSTDVEIRNCKSSGNERNGLTVQQGQRVRIAGGAYFNNVEQTPAAGIDIEPPVETASGAQPAENIIVDGVNLYGNKEYQILVTGAKHTSNLRTWVEDVEITNCMIQGGSDAAHKADIYVQVATGVRIDGNHLDGGSTATKASIAVEEADWVQTINNRISDKTHTNPAISYSVGNPVRPSVSGNTIDSHSATTNPSIVVTTTSDHIVGPNQVDKTSGDEVDVNGTVYEAEAAVVNDEQISIPGYGSADQILGMNGAGTALEWLNQPSGTIPSAVAEGDILVANSTPDWAVFSKGTADQMLVMDGTGTTLTWTNQPSGTLPSTSTDGDMLRSNGSNFVVLAPPANGDYGLTFTGTGDPTYTAVPTETEFTNHTGATTLHFTGTEKADQLPTAAQKTTLGRLPATAPADGSILTGDGTNWIESAAAAAAGDQVPTFAAGAITGWKTAKDAADLPASVGAAGKILRSNGTDYAETTATYPNAAGAAGKILRSNGTNFVESTATYPATAGDLTILYGNSTNFVELSKGTADQVLSMNGTATALTWATASGGGSTPSWTAWSPTITGSTTDPTFGTHTFDGAYSHNGKILTLLFHFSQTTAGTAGSGTYLVELPNSLVADTALVPTSAADAHGTAVGVGGISITNAHASCRVQLHSSTELKFFCPLGASFLDADSAFYILTAAPYNLTFAAEVPVTTNP